MDEVVKSLIKEIAYYNAAGVNRMQKFLNKTVFFDSDGLNEIYLKQISFLYDHYRAGTYDKDDFIQWLNILKTYHHPENIYLK